MSSQDQEIIYKRSWVTFESLFLGASLLVSRKEVVSPDTMAAVPA